MVTTNDEIELTYRNQNLVPLNWRHVVGSKSGAISKFGSSLKLCGGKLAQVRILVR